MNNITELETELTELKSNLNQEILLSVALLICSLLGSYIAFSESFLQLKSISIFILIFLVYLRNVLSYDAAHKQLAFFWERILHKSLSDVRVKRFLDNNYEQEAFLYLNKNENGYSRKKKWNNNLLYK